MVDEHGIQAFKLVVVALLSPQIHIPYYILDNQFVEIYLNVGFEQMFFWYTFLDPHLDTHHLNIDAD